MSPHPFLRGAIIIIPAVYRNIWRSSSMPDEEIIGYATAIAGGLGLGLLVGSEHHGTSATLLGGACVLIAIAGIARSHLKKRRNE
jgi:hypothetical protein